MKGGWLEKTPPATATIAAMDELDKRELRQEIKHWWQAVADHLDNVVCPFFPHFQSLYLKPPPRRRSSPTKKSLL